MAGMMDCILEQGDTMRRVVRNMPEETRKVADCVGTAFERIYLIGSGTSLNAAHVVQTTFEACTGAEVRIVTPYDFLYYFPTGRIDGGTLVLGISQTARSIGTIKCVQRARTLGAKTVFVTAEPENEGAGTAHTTLDTWTGLELVGAKTKGFTSTIAALLALAHRLAGRDVDLSALPGYLDETLKITEQAIRPCIEDLLHATSATVVSYGPCMGVAREGALKITETVRIPVETYDVEEYMHGPYHCLEADSRLIFLAPPGSGQERAGRLLAFAQEISNHTLLIANRSFAASFHSCSIALPDGLEEVQSAIGYAAPLQWLANDTTLRLGRSPEASRYPNFHKHLGSKHMPPINYYTGNDTE